MPTLIAYRTSRAAERGTRQSRWFPELSRSSKEYRVSRAEDPNGGAALGAPQRSAEGPLKYRKEPHKSNRGNNPQSFKCWKCLTFPEPQWETLSIKELQVAF